MKSLRRSSQNRVIGGVASGIAEYFNLDPVLIRLAFVLLAFLGGAGVPIYIIAWIVMPESRSGDYIQDAEIVSDDQADEKKKTESSKPNFERVKQDFKDIEDSVHQKVDERMKQRSGWFGYVLILLGVLFLLRVFDVFYFSVFDVLRLWPILLIFLGVAVIPLKRWLKNILLILCLIFFVILLFNNHSQWSCSSKRSYHYSVNHNSVGVSGNLIKASTSREGDEAELNVDVGACTIVFSDTTEKLSQLKLDGEEVSYVDYTDAHRQQAEKFRIDSDKWLNPEVNIALNINPVWDIDLNIGASDANLDLTLFKVKDLEIHSGAAAIDVKIGDRHPNSKIDIETGVSEVTLHIPKQAGCKVISEGFLVSKDLPGFVKSNGVYRTENFGNSSQTVVVEIEGAISDFQIVRY